jgi:protein-tyrosine phosphatase
MDRDKPRILFVCGRNQWRSPTAARIYAKDQRIEVRSAGVSPRSGKRLTHQDVRWADLILVMEREYRQRIIEAFTEVDLPPIVSLDIPDDYRYMDEELVELIRESTEPVLKSRYGM